MQVPRDIPYQVHREYDINRSPRYPTELTFSGACILSHASRNSCSFKSWNLNQFSFFLMITVKVIGFNTGCKRTQSFYKHRSHQRWRPLLKRMQLICTALVESLNTRKFDCKGTHRSTPSYFLQVSPQNPVCSFLQVKTSRGEWKMGSVKTRTIQ